MPSSAKKFGEQPRPRSPKAYNHTHQRLREACFARAEYQCEECKRRQARLHDAIDAAHAAGNVTLAAELQYQLDTDNIGLAEIADHIVPHEGDIERLRSLDNYQALCRVCERAKTSEESRQRALKQHKKN